ncbi:hypothetical protein FisN_1Hh110 [Fistulifera solaris]|uniref:DUF6824 domain-containing protein n=1 Tax=Fistulifera solaris TaxID=1519565 RepID=A0A1Z5JDV8_FISSO|nr:hypothetical protein FisN_1Hh110 [Fistulifera solaris]|eukprot:GAX12184.1 hypothetical protein FisN_1Hh110 [Fistulifera solaris]
MSNNNQDDSIIQDDALTTAEDEQAIIPDVTSKLSDDDKEGEPLESGEAGSVDESKGESTDDNMEEANNEGEPPVANDGVDEEARLQEEKERKERWKDYPLKDVDEVHDHDVLFGRGGGTNHHLGNKRYRKMVEDRKIDYVNSKRLDKPLVALDIIRIWRNQDPPGRFLKFDEKTKKWNDVGDKKAREKTSQALREKAPLIRQHLEHERRAAERGDSTDEDEVQEKSTQFAEGTKSHDGAKKGGASKAVLARDHSLGREYLKPNEQIALEGFSWQDPFRSTSTGDVSQERITSTGSFGPPPPGAYPPGYRYPSYGSVGPPPQPPPAAYQHMASGGRYESWGSLPGFSWDREHSLGQNPLPHVSLGHPIPYTTFREASRGYSGPWAYPGHWGPPPPNGYPPYPYHSGGPPQSPQGGYPAPARDYSGSSLMQYPSPTQTHNKGASNSRGSTPGSGPPSPRYEVDPVVASTWSARNPADEEIARSWSNSSGDGVGGPPALPGLSTDNPRRAGAPRPDLVKRATSNQNETLETKPGLQGPSVKRCALNRDSSAAANRLKEQYIPGFTKRTDPEQFEQEMHLLSSNFEQSTLGPETTVKPKPISTTARISTLDEIAMDLMTRPEPLLKSGRSTTIEALALDVFDDDFLLKSDVQLESALDLGELSSKFGGVERPSTLTYSDRLSTNEVFDLMDAPIVDDDAALVSGKR